MNNRIEPASETSHRRWRLWLPLLALSFYLVWQAPSPQEDADIVRPVLNRPQPTSERAAPAESVPLLAIQDRHATASHSDPKAQDDASGVDLFSQRSWTPPPRPQPVVKASPPPPPMAPPLPFTLIGKQWNGTSWEVYLSRGDFTHIVREGTQFAQHYQVERIAPPHMTLIYLPLEQTQTMYIGESP